MSRKSPLSQSRCKAMCVPIGWLLAAPLCLGGAAGAATTLLGTGAYNPGGTPVAGGLEARMAGQDLDRAGLRQAELSADPDELWAFNPRFCLRVLLLRAGRGVPATVSAARRAERLAQRESALEWLRVHLAADAEVARLWESEVRGRLREPGQQVLWIATVRTLGRLGGSSFALEIAEDLGSSDPVRARTAQLALFDLYLRWFETQEEFYAFWPEALASCERGVYMTTAREKDEEARQLLIQLLDHEPSRAAGLLKHPDPRLRAAAIGVLQGNNGDADEVPTASILAHLETEMDGMAFHATVNALLQSALTGPSAGDALQRMRGVFGQRIRQGQVGLQAPIADALRRLPWSSKASGEDSLGAALDVLVTQVQRLADPARLTDRDTLMVCLSSLHSVAERAVRADLPVVEALAPLGDMLLGMIEEPREADGVRIAAAQFLTLLANDTGLERAVKVLDAPGSSAELRYNLLAAVGDMGAKLSPTDPAAQLVLRTLLVHVQGEDANLRRRSLQYLGSEAFAPLLSQADPGAFIASLARETVPELQIQLLDLIAALGSYEHLSDLVALPNFDAICTSGPLGLTRLAQTIRSLAGVQASGLVRAIGRLLEVPDGDTRVMRLREALGAVAALPLDSVKQLDAADHHRIVLWSMELRGAAGSVPGGRGFLDRLLQEHLVGCRSMPELQEAPELAHVRALFLSDLIALDPSAAEPTEVVDEFARALALSAQSVDRPRHQLILRDRARYQLDRGAAGAAQADYLELFAVELPKLEANPQAQSNLLDQRDLRRAAALFAQPPGANGSAESTERHPEVALRASLVLVQRPIWMVEPVALRTQDLRDLAERALALGDPPALVRARAIFAGLPPLPAPPVEGQAADPLPQPPEGALWAGLLEAPGVHGELVQYAKRLADHGRALQAPAQAPVDQKPDPPADSASGEPKEGIESAEKESSGGG